MANIHTYTMKCAKCKTKTHIGIKFEDFTIEDIWKYVAYTAEDIYNKLKNLEDMSPLVADEAVNFAMGEDWMMGKNKKVKNLVAKCRTNHLIFYMNIPKFSWIQGKYRDDMTSGWFRIVRRGLAIFLIPDLGEDSDSWHLKDFNKHLGSYNILTSKSELIKKIFKLRSKHPCFFDYFWIPRFPDRLYKMYTKIRHYYVFKHDEDNSTHTDHFKLLLYNLKYNWVYFRNIVGGRPSPTSKMISKILLYNPKTRRLDLKVEAIKQLIYHYRNKLDEKGIHETYMDEMAEKLKKLH